ncbi:hypothetical protein, partial [Burkholderia ubonensis]|uniref:hypothetical protein n=1 Tax=Burkholderia ubonensis TaxID=101571 RepID=UPI001E478964
MPHAAAAKAAWTAVLNHALGVPPLHSLDGAIKGYCVRAASRWACAMDLSVILWAGHIMRVKSHGYADEEEE